MHAMPKLQWERDLERELRVIEVERIEMRDTFSSMLRIESLHASRSLVQCIFRRRGGGAAGYAGLRDGGNNQALREGRELDWKGS